MRAYPRYRFHDKSAVYYGLEYRVIPDWNPLKVEFLRYFDIDWWQLVGIFEAGRVAPNWNAGMLFRNLRWDAGIGLRVMARKVVLRLDTAFSDEGWSAWVMAGQAF